MSKRGKIILTIIVIALIIIPISTFATKRIIDISPLTTDEAIEEANQREKERVLAERNETKDSSEIPISPEYTEEELQAIEKEKQEHDEKENKIKEIISRYYKDELDTILYNMENDNNNQMVDLSKNPITDNEKQLLNLVLKILEEEDLSIEDANVLKDFLRATYDTLDNDASLKARADKILE